MTNYLIVISLIVFFISCSSTNQAPTKSTNQKKAELYYQHGTQQLISKEYTQALKNLLQSYQINPNDSKTNNNLGMAYFFKNNFERAIIHFNEAIKNDPDNLDARNNLASVLFRQKNYQEARKQYIMVSRSLTYEKQFRTYYNLGLIELVQGNKSGALVNFERSIKENSNYCPAPFEIGRIYYNDQNYKKALHYFSEGSKGECYQFPESKFMKVQTYLKLNKPQQAKSVLENIIAMHSDSQYYRMAKKTLAELEVKDSTIGLRDLYKNQTNGVKYSEDSSSDNTVKTPSF